MSLKIAATLIVAGLMAQSSGNVIRGSYDTFDVPGFSYTCEKNADHDKLSVSADEGGLMWTTFSRNHTAWSFHQVGGSSTISQEVSDPYLNVLYFIVKASVGDATNEWAGIEAHLGTATFIIFLTATGNDKKCKLEINVANSKTGIQVETFKMDKAFKARDVVDALGAAIWEEIGDVLPATLTDLLQRNLSRRINTKALCKQLLTAKPEAFPEPEL